MNMVFLKRQLATVWPKFRVFAGERVIKAAVRSSAVGGPDKECKTARKSTFEFNWKGTPQLLYKNLMQDQPPDIGINLLPLCSDDCVL